MERRRLLETKAGPSANILVLEIFETTGQGYASEEQLTVIKQMLEYLQNNIPFVPMIKHSNQYKIPYNITFYEEGDFFIGLIYYTGINRGVNITLESDLSNALIKYINIQ